MAAHSYNIKSRRYTDSPPQQLECFRTPLTNVLITNGSYNKTISRPDRYFQLKFQSCCRNGLMKSIELIRKICLLQLNLKEREAEMSIGRDTQMKTLPLTHLYTPSTSHTTLLLNIGRGLRPPPLFLSVKQLHVSGSVPNHRV